MSTADRMPVAFFVGGEGTTLAAVLRAIQVKEVQGVWPALIIASKPNIGAVEKARAFGIADKDIVVYSSQHYSPQSFGERLLVACKARGVHIICQYGWRVHTPSIVIDAHPARMINAHPGPLNPEAPPGYDFGGQGMFGLRVIAAHLYFVRETGRTPAYTEAVAHRVNRNYDRGEVLVAEQLEIDPERDTPESIRERLRPVEHRVQISALNDLAQGRARNLVRPAYSFVKPEEGHVLEVCKRQAVSNYPRG